ncbi:hypothetical protein L218DRAFT_171857 [Marasmius fiardii PR-910]|nr:hypothetical protein L218DRAFT_171857 [Marasmius fiardii PR-910]
MVPQNLMSASASLYPLQIEELVIPLDSPDSELPFSSLYIGVSLRFQLSTKDLLKSTRFNPYSPYFCLLTAPNFHQSHLN